MNVEDYMGYFVPSSDDALAALEGWRKAFALHHAKLMALMKSVPGCIGANYQREDGKVIGLVFPKDAELPAGWRWNNALKAFAVPHVTSQKVVDMAAARRHRDSLEDVGTYDTGWTVALRLGFLTDYSYETSEGAKGSSGIGPIGNPAQIVFVGEDGPILLYAPHARRCHDLFVEENLQAPSKLYGDPAGFKVTNGADVWEVPEGFKEVSKNEWELMAAQHRVELEKKDG